MGAAPDPLQPEASLVTPAATPSKRGIAPVWHTLILIVALVALSAAGALRQANLHSTLNRLLAYATAMMELIMLGWVAFGLRLRKIPLRSLLGAMSRDFRSVVRDFWIALVFWLGSMAILGGVGMAWTRVEAEINPQKTGVPGKLNEPTPSERRATRTMEQIAPENGEEIACWVVLCAIAGFVEEVVFRGYLQSQFTAWAHGGAAAGVVFSAMLFGAAHGYQGARNMVMLAVFGVLFSLLALSRRNLRACIFAHGWHDLVAGLALGVLRAHHVV